MVNFDEQVKEVYSNPDWLDKMSAKNMTEIDAKGPQDLEKEDICLQDILKWYILSFFLATSKG
ncbi:hypothetical protein DSO57_1028713 [Entomophthora muscae]|uniref:Uncharacterized protein n=1 Tax=Entomophthora muscae TaxID=34485 RepID=A0ACC2TCD7_9FUNG|nr:hypothetical protein DSO57_1028713 [Entomophthora muscae]